MVPYWIMAGFWGLLAGSASFIGALFAYFFKVPQRIVAVFYFLQLIRAYGRVL